MAIYSIEHVYIMAISVLETNHLFFSTQSRQKIHDRSKNHVSFSTTQMQSPWHRILYKPFTEYIYASIEFGNNRNFEEYRKRILFQQ